MKKLSLFSLALAMLVGVAHAAPVDLNKAQSYGQSFVRNSLGQKSAEVTLTYTKNCENGLPALYVFGYDHGYVIVAADDRAYPILAYSDNGHFDANNLPDGLQCMLNHYARQVQYAVDHDLVAEAEVMEQWYLLGKEGVTSAAKLERAVNPLLTTSWNQDYPYNYYAPAGGGAYTGGHCYAGCVATAMSQVMKFWNWPETGNGEHSYNTSSYGGTQSANFGATTYNWSIMTNSVYSLTPAAQAIALLMYHCGVAVDMDYNPGGSGAHTEDVPDAIINYFRYGQCAVLMTRDSYTRTVWENILKEQLDRRLPMVYSAYDDNGGGGHAFVCDGYDNQNRFNFNYGWSGYCDNYYYIDALNLPSGDHFNTGQRAVVNMIPDYIYASMVPPMETLAVSVTDAVTKTVQVSFVVPEVSESGDPLTSVERIVLKRNGTAVHTFTDVHPGDAVSYEDVVDEYGAYEYSIYGVNNNVDGKKASTTLIVGPNCTWKIVCQTTNFQGWNGGKIQVLSANGTIFKEFTMVNSTPMSEKFQMPEGDYSLQWYAPVTAVSSLTIALKNSANQSAYSFTGSSTQLSGVFHQGTNDCEGCTPPTNLTGEPYFENGEFGTRLTWTCDYTPNKFKVYRSDDGVEYEEIASIANTLNEYLDPIAIGNYYYRVTAFSSTCESTPALTIDNYDYVYVTVTGVSENGVKALVYPNPVKGILHIQAEGIEEVNVFDVLGQSVYHYSGMTDAVEFNTSNLKSGIYTVRVVADGGMVSKRIIVK